jgi:hypothetical protein
VVVVVDRAAAVEMVIAVDMKVRVLAVAESITTDILLQVAVAVVLI